LKIINMFVCLKIINMLVCLQLIKLTNEMHGYSVLSMKYMF